MNNKGTKAPAAQKRGFYIALYSILAALLVLAAVISYNNYTAVNRAREMRVQIAEEELRAQIAEEELQAANASQVQSYLAQSGTRTTPTSPPTAPRNERPAPRTAPEGTAAPRTESTAPTQQPATTPGAPASSPAPARPASSAETEPPAEQQQTPAPNESPAPVQQSEAEPAEPATPATPDSTPIPPPSRTSELAPPIAEVFTEGDMMRWPVLGEVVMDYSRDAMVYDRTLEHFRTNDILCIATDIGTPVHAAAGGVVQSVTHTRELGNRIVLDHGNGWMTSYNQLQDGVLVREGEVVDAGQVIGGVGAPSLYYVLLGNHLGFAVSHNDNYLDPKQLLE